MNSSITPVTTESSAKSVKTIEKIKLLTLTFAELKETGAAEIIVKLRKHSDIPIAQSAKKLRDYWKEKYATEAVAAAAAAPVVPPVPPTIE